MEENGVGYTVESLHDVQKLMEMISENKYKKMAERVREVSKRLIDGEYMQTALTNAMSIICK